VKRERDPWHTVTVTAVTVPAKSPEFEDDVELRFDVVHPEPHENGCPENCMTQHEIYEQADGLPTEPGVYRVRAWGEYWPATLAGDPAEFDGGAEVERVEAVAR
jgi:hypothetical protein